MANGFRIHRVGCWDCVAIHKTQLDEQPHEAKVHFEVIGRTYAAAMRLANMVMDETYGNREMKVISCVRAGMIYR